MTTSGARVGARHEPGGVGDVDGAGDALDAGPAQPQPVSYSSGRGSGSWRIGIGGRHGGGGAARCRPATPTSVTSPARRQRRATSSAATAVPPGTSCQHCSRV